MKFCAISAGTIRFTKSKVTISEGVGTYTAQVERVYGTKGTVTATLDTKSSTATYTSDYKPVTGNLVVTWSDGEDGTKNFPITIIDDTVGYQKLANTMIYYMLH